MKVLLTGCAGFIGYHLSTKLLEERNQIFGIDNINNYYDQKVKKDRLKKLKKYKNFKFFNIDLKNYSKTENLVKINKIKIIIHLAAQAGVRYSIANPRNYFENNIEVFFNILEICKVNQIKHLIYASSSSVYGDNNNFPLTEKDTTDKPKSFYAATKKTNEILAYSYSSIYKIPTTALRFFTVYGPFGRPDMALFKFTQNILNNKKVDLYNNGKHFRDFTYVDDVTIGISKLLFKPSKKAIPFEIFNIGNGNPKKLLTYLRQVEKNLKLKAKINKLPMQKGDVLKTHSSIKKLNNFVGYKPSTNIEKGVSEFIDWYKKYYKIN